MIRILIFACLFLSNYAFSQDSKVFPVIGETIKVYDTMSAKEPSATFPAGQFMGAYDGKANKGQIATKSNSKIGDTTTEDLKRIAQDVRNELCSVLKKGDIVKVNLSWDASAKVWGIGVSGGGGVELQIAC